MSERQTIYALSSGVGVAGVAVVRVSGPRSQEIAAGVCGKVPDERRAVLSTLRHPTTGDLIDRGLVLWFGGPRSYTGEDCVEFQVHGGVAVVEALFGAIGGFAEARLAEPGEFTLRAFQNGRMDLLEVEALSDLISARTEAQRRQALHQLDGGVKQEITAWRKGVLELRALAEATVDFVDEAGVSEAAQSCISDKLDDLIRRIEQALATAAKGRAIRDGIRVVIAGPPNAGKSSLLNFLAGREAAIVSPAPGTTRDVIEVMLNMDGLPVVFSDTAGLREDSPDEIEQMGMDRAQAEIERAHCVIWLTETAAVGPPHALFDSYPIWVQNKCDLPQAKSGLIRNEPHYRVSVRTKDGMADFLDGLKQRVSKAFDTGEAAVVVRARQRECLQSLLKSLQSARKQPVTSIELLAEDLRAGSDAIGRLTGAINVEDVLGEIFSAFCIGK